MHRITIWLALCLGSAALAADDNVVQCRVKGHGPSRDRAIQNGLGLAVGEVHGVAVSTGLATADVRAGNLDVTRDPATGGKSLSVGAVAVRAAGSLTLTEAAGMVKSYEVVEEKQVSPEVYEVTLDVWVFDYHSPEDTSKLRLAVMPVQVTPAVCRFGPTTVPGARVGEQFTQSLVGALAQNEKFTVLDRDSTAAIEKDRQVLGGEDAKPEEKARLRQTAGADYLLVTTIPQAEILIQTRTDPLVGRPTQEFDARVQAEFRVLVGPTRQVKMADELRIRLKDSQVGALASQGDSDEIDYTALRRNLIRLAAVRVASRVADILNPVRIAAVGAPSQVILNQGGSRFTVGDELDVYKPGAIITDPETRNELGRQETLVGRIQITRVLPRICYAWIIQGSMNESAVGSVCRHVQGIEDLPFEPEGGRKNQIRTTPSGGVKLPFDK